MLIRDPVHGDVELSQREAAVLNLPVMQRLRGIKQLGTAHLVYPGAVHTRFDHSLGVCAVSHRIVAALRRNGVTISAELEDLIGVGALLHDVTHVPFGHTLEDERRLFARHDKGWRLTEMLAGELGDGLAQLGIRNVIAGLLGASPSLTPNWAQDVISGTIDADLLDYLRRDSFFAGLSHDYDDRIFQYFAVGDERLIVRMARHGMDRPDARSEIIRVLRMRYFLTERVYYHHTKVVAGAMISKAVELALQHGVLVESDLLKLNDWTLLDRLMHCGVDTAAALATHVHNRTLLKRGYVVSARSIPLAQRAEWVADYHSSPVKRTQIETELAHRLGLPFEDVILYCPALTVMKEATMPVETRLGLTRLSDEAGEASAEIAALQESYAGLWRFYLFVPEAATARAAVMAAEIFGVATEHLRDSGIT